MLRMLSLLESRNCLLHLWTSLERKGIQPKSNKLRLDALSVPHHVIKKVRPRGARHGTTEAQKEHFKAHNARRRRLKQKNEGIHDRFQRDSTHRDSQLKIGWTEEKCVEMDKLAQENHSYCPSSEDFERNKKNW